MIQTLVQLRCTLGSRRTDVWIQVCTVVVKEVLKLKLKAFSVSLDRGRTTLDLYYITPGTNREASEWHSIASTSVACAGRPKTKLAVTLKVKE